MYHFLQKIFPGKSISQITICGVFFFLLISSFLNTAFADSNQIKPLQYITPTYVKSVTAPYEQFNDINPNWSLDGDTISYERFDSLTHEIVLVDKDGERLKLVSTNADDDSDLDLLLPEITQSQYFAFNISWSPDNENYVFISNGSSDNFDLYLGNLNDKEVTRITNHEAIDNQAQWSPKSDKFVFVSSRLDRANLHIYDIKTKQISLVTSQVSDTLNPVWSPDGSKIAFMQGEGNSFQIYIIDDINHPKKTLRKITNLPGSNNIRPSWSPNGKKLSFFTLNIEQSLQQHWQIAVVDSNTTTAITPQTINQHIVSDHVIQNSLNGPSWLPDNKHIAYIQYIDDTYNPIHLVNITNKQQGLVLTNTKMNRDVSCSTNGTLAFQSQDEQWSRIFIAKLPGFKG